VEIMSTASLIFFVCVFCLFLVIGAVAMRLNAPKLLGVIAGLMVGGLLGFCFAGCWAAWTGNLMMGESEYERRKAGITATFLLIIGCTGMIGALIGFLRTRK
jgi:hypothetical protein